MAYYGTKEQDSIRSISDAEETIRYYGYDWQSQTDRNILIESCLKAINFINESFIDGFNDPLHIHPEVVACKSGNIAKKLSKIGL